MVCAVYATQAEENNIFGSELSTLPSNSVYVVEVFTSQGCSSCPPADANVSLLYDQAKRTNVDLYVLAWHVDYWDYLGWKDPYGSSVSNRRQSDYARRMRRTTRYTPQVMVNGNVEVDNPYKAASIVSALRSAGRSHRAVNIDLRAQTDRQSVNVTYTQQKSLSTSGKNYDIGVLIVEDGIVTLPTRGENNGRKLTNNHVIRASQFARLRKSGQISIDIPANINRARSEAIVIAQDRRTHQIAFAQSVGL